MGYVINHKTVQNLMSKLGLKSNMRPKRYNSYKGDAGRTCPHILKREFEADKPNKKWVTDVTEFKVKGEKVYLSPILDLYNREIISYTVSKSVKLPLVTTMINKALLKLNKRDKPVLHSDQGWQYQHRVTQNLLKKNNIKQSMSRKGNCLDNAVVENFFGILKSEMYHHQEFDSADHLINEINAYIDYYNNKRIKVKLKGLTPVEFRNQALKAG
ncbi:MAG: hypothetical protein CMD81_11145 [Gammaproteobacteria bacterium]|nr:hypothetical protein [Gammaproteobacteria bacterium]MBK84375.1 hypothetical protein [Gammaproteobacteria bacterium]|tara:strand:- start:32 stop:673 length:642 start_codon:yes stop_codon:yes gene_type:complete